MKFIQKSAVLAAIAVGMLGFVGAQDPVKALADLREFSSQTITAAQAGGQSALNEARSKVLAKAKEAVAGVDAAKVEPKDGLAWAQLFQMARQVPDARTAAERFLTSNPPAAEKFTANTIIAGAYANEKKGAELYDVIDRMEPSTPQQNALAANYAASYADLIKEAKGLDTTLALLDKAEARLNPKATDERERQMSESLVYGLASTRMELLKDAGRKDDAIRALDAAAAKLNADSKVASTIKILKNQLTIVGNTAPSLKVERGYGDFAGLDKLKGKVVLLDFFAHWCGPCKAAFPEMRQLYSDLKPKGLEIVGVTTYYGYYGKEQGLSKDAEYGKMADFIKEFQLPWSVQYGDRTNFEAYGVTGIPHVVVIDKQGNVRKIRVGYYPNGIAAFRAELEKMLAE